MVLALIGMSGVGKTMWASKLALGGFICLHCDDLIADKLRVHGDISGTSVEDVGRWMGFPFDADYAKREAKYLAYESEVLATISRSLPRAQVEHRRLVIDMTGSAIYIDPTILDSIRSVATFVYLMTPPAHYTRLLEAYCASPRPVIWKNSYLPLPNEEPQMALTRCYPQLLHFRASLYTSLSDVVIDPGIHQNPAVTVVDFLRAVEGARPEG